MLCISKNKSNCFCNKQDYNDPDNYNFLEQHLLEDVPLCYCKHYRLPMKASRRNVTLKEYCKNASYEIAPCCYECKKMFNHLDWYTYFWGCRICIMEIFLLEEEGDDIAKILFCENCSNRRLLFDNEFNRKTGSFITKSRITSKRSFA